MGCKCTSRRKPKKIKQTDFVIVSGNSQVQALVKDKVVSAQSDKAKTPGTWNKENSRFDCDHEE